MAKPNFNPPIEENTEGAEEKLKETIKGFLDEVMNYNDDFENYRKFFKENKDKLFDYQDKIILFKEKAKKFNSFLENITKSITAGQIVDGLGKEHLQLLTNLQLAQIKSTRVHSRINKCKIEVSLKKIENIEKKSEKYLTENKNMEINLKNIYSGFISVIGIFLSVFVLVSININFFKDLVNFKDKKELLLFFMLVNSVAIISITFLVALVHNFVFLATSKDSNKSNECFSLIISVAFIFLIIIIMLIR